MQPDQNILNLLVGSFLGLLTGGARALKPDAISLLTLLITLDFILALVFNLLKDEGQGAIPTVLFSRIFKYGAFVYLVVGTTTSGYATIVNMIEQGFVAAGLAAAGNSMSINDFSNPSQIATTGLKLAWSLINTPADPGAQVSLWAKVTVFVCGLIIIFAFFFVAIRIFTLQITFGIVAASGLILIPFGVWKPTEFIFEKHKHNIIKLGLRFMFMAFVIGMVNAKAADWASASTDGITYQQAVYLAIGSLALSFLTVMAERVSTMTGAASFKGIKQMTISAVSAARGIASKIPSSKTK